MLDKLTYAGNPANLDGVDAELVVGRHRRPGRRRRRRRAGCDAIVNFAAETHVDRSILGAARLRPTRTSLGDADAARLGARAPTPGSSRSRPTRSTATSSAAAARVEDDPLRPSSPYSASKAGGDLQVLAYVRTYGVDASITRGANTYGPNQYPEKLLPLFVTNALDGEPLPVYGDGRQVREWLHVEDHCAGIELVLARGRAGRGLQRRRRGAREPARSRDGSSSSTGADASLVRHVEDRAGHDRRYSLDTTKLRGARLDAAARARRTASPRRSTGTATTAPGGSRSSPAGTARTTSSQYAERLAALALSPRQALASSRAARSISLRRPWICSERSSSSADAVAAAEREARDGEVVVRVRLGERRPMPSSSRDRLLEQRQRAGEVAGLHLLVALVVELGRRSRLRRRSAAAAAVGRGRRRRPEGRGGGDGRRGS